MCKFTIVFIFIPHCQCCFSLPDNDFASGEGERAIGFVGRLYRRCQFIALTNTEVAAF